MTSKIVATGIFALMIFTSFLSTQDLNEHQLKHAPDLSITELDFGREVITFCMFEGVKIKFELELDDFKIEDVKVKVSKGEVDLSIWDETKQTYLINPKMDAFQIDVWVKFQSVKNIQVPVVNGKIADHDETGVYKTANANWKPIVAVYPVEEGYVKLVSNWKLYGRPCE